MHRSVPETKRTHLIHFFGPNSDVLVRLGQFRCCAENHAGVAFNAPIRAGNETMHRFIQKRNERAKSTLMDPIVLFWFVWVSFVTVPKIMPVLHLMHRSGPEMKRCTDSSRNKTNAPNPVFWTQY